MPPTHLAPTHLQVPPDAVRHCSDPPLGLLSRIVEEVAQTWNLMLKDEK